MADYRKVKGRAVRDLKTSRPTGKPSGKGPRALRRKLKEDNVTEARIRSAQPEFLERLNPQHPARKLRRAEAMAANARR